MPGEVVDRYYVGQGEAILYERTALGLRANGRKVGNCPQIRLSGQQQEIKHVEDRTGKRLTDNKIIWMPEAAIEVTFDNFSVENLAWLTDGTASKPVGGSVTAEVQSYGQIMQLDKFNISGTVTAKKTAAVGNWPVDSFTVSKSGLVTIVTDPPAAGVVAGDPIEFNYTYLGHDQVTALNASNKEYWLSVHGINKAENDQPVLLDCFRVKFRPNFTWELIGQNYGTLQIAGEILYDAKQPISTGRMFQERMLSAA